jgi:hypothetical protein
MSHRSSQLATNQASSPARTYEAKPRERAQIAAYFDRQKRKPLAPRVTLQTKETATEVSAVHPDARLGQTLLMHALGVTDPVLFDTLLTDEPRGMLATLSAGWQRAVVSVT